MFTASRFVGFENDLFVGSVYPVPSVDEKHYKAHSDADTKVHQKEKRVWDRSIIYRHLKS